MIIFDLSKIIMYNFYYNYIQRKYGDCVRFWFIDIDLQMYEIRIDDFFFDIFGDFVLKFDILNYLKDYQMYFLKNKKVMG